ncbi:hypothetical protein BSKO_11954 [Bryopsis sp. KO-2023]|nr:hypothetical protein BSKO_11954 [Bryopsis sp. KO-2023]
MPTKALSTLASTVEKLKKGKSTETLTAKQLSRQVAALQEGFLSLADALFDETQAVQLELSQWQEEREAWSRAMDRVAGEVGTRMNEVDRLRAEANTLLQAAKAEAASIAKSEMHGLNCRIDEMHKQTIHLRDDMQAQVREFTTSMSACEKLSNMQEELWELQRWRDANTPQILTDMMVSTVEEIVTSHTTQLLGEIDPKQLREDMARVQQSTHSASVALAKDISAISGELKTMQLEQLKHAEVNDDNAHRLENRISKLEQSDPQEWLAALQDELDILSKRRLQQDNTVEDVFQTILTDMGSMSSQVQKLECRVDDMGAKVGVHKNDRHKRYTKRTSDRLSIGDVNSTMSTDSCQ